MPAIAPGDGEWKAALLVCYVELVEVGMAELGSADEGNARSPYVVLDGGGIKDELEARPDFGSAAARIEGWLDRFRVRFVPGPYIVRLCELSRLGVPPIGRGGWSASSSKSQNKKVQLMRKKKIVIMSLDMTCYSPVLQ
jgi:hypothetical protein